MYIPYKKFRGDALYVMEYNDALEVFTSIWRGVFDRSKNPDIRATADLASDKAMWDVFFSKFGFWNNGHSDRRVYAWHQAYLQAWKDMRMSWESF